VYLANPCFSRDEILAAIARDLGLTDLASTMEGKLAALQQELLRRHAMGQRVVLVIDEAHAMPIESLEEVRLLSNLETGQNKLINIMLFGQPELDTLLADPRLRQVRDRVIHRFELQALRADETSAYIDHRLRAAGWQGAGLFSESALERLVKASEGRARRINLLADKALLAAYAQGALKVETSHVKSAMQELPRASVRYDALLQPNHWRDWGKSLGLSVVLAGVMTVIAMSVLGWYRNELPTPTLTPSTTPTQLALPTASKPLPVVQADVQHRKKFEAKPTPAVALPPVSVPASTPLPPAVLNKSRGLSVHAQSVIDRTQALLQTGSVSGYTVQLGALDSVAALDHYLYSIESLLDSSHIYAQFSDYKGKTFVAVYFGNFATLQDCARAIESLPPAVKNNRPLVRSWAKVKQERTP
jgi:hypothetical protein